MTGRRAVVVVGCLVLVTVVAIVIGQATKSQKPATQSASASSISFTKPATAQGQKTSQPTDVNAAISQNLSSQALDGSYSLESVSEPTPGWLIASISFEDFDGTQKMVLHRDSAGNLSVIAGPTTLFSLTALQSAGVPDAIINQLNYDEN